MIPQMQLWRSAAIKLEGSAQSKEVGLGILRLTSPAALCSRQLAYVSRLCMLDEAFRGKSPECSFQTLMLKFRALENGFGCLSQARSRQGMCVEMMHMNNLAVPVKQAGSKSITSAN
jgi:hypothetical protein